MKSRLVSLTLGLLIAVNSLNAQNNWFDKQFNTIDSLQQEGLPREAMPLYDSIYKRAFAEKNNAVLVKAIIGQNKNSCYLEEEPLVTIVDRLKADVQQLEAPAKQIVYSLLADIYWNYYRQNRWRFHNRTTVSEPVGGDMRTWDLSRLTAEMLDYLQLSLTDEKILKNTSVGLFSSLLEGDSTLRSLRPTLYDMLAQRALDLIENPEVGLTRPADAFTLNDPSFFAPASEFVQTAISTNDTLSLRYQSISIYQKLTRFRLKDDNVEALMELELNRVNYVFSNSQNPEKDSLSVSFYQKLLNAELSRESKAEVMYRLALFHFNQQEQGKDDRLRLSMVLCNRVLADYPETMAATYAKSLKAKIEKPELDITTERVELPGKPFRMLVGWKNLDNAHFTLYKFTSAKAQTYQRQWNFVYDSVANWPVFRSWDQPLPHTNDYLNHKAEAAVEALPAGYYLLVATDSANIEKNQCRAGMLMQVSSLSVMSRNAPEGMLYVVSNSVTGLPVKGATVQLSKLTYKRGERKWTFDKYKQQKTNASGEVLFSLEANESYTPFVFFEGDTLQIENQYYDGISESEEDKTITFYTDRAIYRPGQTVHFSGIVLKRKGEDCSVVNKFKDNIKLMDVNWQEVASVAVVSNEYGTFSGSFTLPSSGLNGMYTLISSYGNSAIQVEEYRRPNFEVLFDKPTQSYSFNDSVKVSGSAKMFSGSSVGGATVSYRITRREEFYGWRWRPVMPEKVVASGETFTNDDGSFVVQFLASADDLDDRKRVMVYTVSVDVTDLNGETHSNEFQLKISDTNLLISCNLPEQIMVNRFAGTTIKVVNLNGEPVSARVNVTVKRLIPPKGFVVNRFWEAPDTFLLDEKTYKEKFPNYPYREENLPQNWAKGGTVFSNVFFLPTDGKVEFPSWIKSKSGYYYVEMKASSSDGKQTAEWSKTVRLLASKPTKAQNTEDWVTPVNTIVEPGDTAEIWLTGLRPDSPIRYELVKGKEILKSEVIKPGKKAYRLLIPVKESFQGDVLAQFTQIANNRHYSEQVDIEVPHTDKMIDIAFTSFRDKLLPGEKETWWLTLTDKSGKGLAAEMVATLFDASLDQFVKHNWQTDFLTDRDNSWFAWNKNMLPRTGKNLNYSVYAQESHWWYKEYETLPLLNFSLGHNYLFGNAAQRERPMMIRGLSIAKSMKTGAVAEADDEAEIIPITRMEEAQADEVYALAGDILPLKGEGFISETEDKSADFSGVQLRANFNETAFFYPNLYSNNDGKLEISFSIPDAITRWRMMGFAHTKDMKLGSVEKELVTRKLVSVSAYAPRFLREDDTLTISAKVMNLTPDSISGNAVLQWTDAVTFASITPELMPADSICSFTIAPNGSSVVTWKVMVPDGLQAVTYKVMAKSGNHSDGEQKTIPVLTNRQLVTESMPFMVRGGETKTMTLEKMANNASKTLTNYSYTIEYTSNPVWYAVQSLPYLMEFPHECAEQLFSRFFANAVASSLVNSSPRIKAVFDAWKTVDTGAFLSNLEKNSELKSVLLQESPWLLSAKSESEAKQRIGLLFDLNRMSNELDGTLKKLKEMQGPDGAFPWFSGMPDNRYITQYIVQGMGEMKQMNSVDPKWEADWEAMRKSALVYLDARMVEDYNQLLKQQEKDSTVMAKYQPSMMQLHYLYARSFWPGDELPETVRPAFDYYTQQAKKCWLSYSEYAQGMLALSSNRFGDEKMANRILKSLADRAIRSQSDGMYWKNNRAGYFWYESPVETQAMLITAFREIKKDVAAVEEMKLCLLRNKQTTHWKTTKATTAACYALLMQGKDLLSESKPLAVKVGSKPLDMLKAVHPEAGTGYVKTAFTASEIKPAMAHVEVENPNQGAAWGATYWQYFEQLDKITASKTDVEIRKQLFVKEKSESGTVLTPISPDAPINVGDEVVVRMEIRTLRDMEYVHLKDLRAAGFEPTETLSGYRWQDGLGYYQEVKDAAVNFFIGYLRKGTYVFEYSLRASQSGRFSNGITTLQCMYAPEFTTHSQGERVIIEP